MVGWEHQTHYESFSSAEGVGVKGQPLLSAGL
jgi:hypothetical protein